jgi:hypothetical protein
LTACLDWTSTSRGQITGGLLLIDQLNVGEDILGRFSVHRPPAGFFKVRIQCGSGSTTELFKTIFSKAYKFKTPLLIDWLISDLFGHHLKDNLVDLK